MNESKKEQKKLAFQAILNDNLDDIFLYPVALDKNFAKDLISMGYDETMMLIFNLEKFNGLDFEIAKQLIQIENWKIDDYVEEYLDCFSLNQNELDSIRSKLDLRGEINAIKKRHDGGESKQEIFDLLLCRGKQEIVLRNLKFFVQEIHIDDNWNKIAEYLTYSEIKTIKSKYNIPLHPLYLKTLEIFGDYANDLSYTVLKSILNNDKKTMSDIGVMDGGMAGIEEIHNGFKNINEYIDERGRIALSSFAEPRVRRLYEVFFAEYIKKEVIRNGQEIVGMKNYIDLRLI